ncbi:MAG: hypothetical protein PWP34_2657 [Desulfuromonadales bacterium]|jgi:hypothetical protein|nr:hypothetical protein [Desulfuromonadales bacterium]
MPYSLSLEDLSYYIPRHDEIRPQDILWLGREVFPGAQASGFVSRFTPNDKCLTLFIDERFAKDFTFIGGVLVLDDCISPIKDFVAQVKSEYRPELRPSEWMIKGSGQWLHDGVEKKETKIEALTRWLLWSRALASRNLSYDFHSATLLSKKYSFKKNKKRAKNIEKFEVIFDALFGTLKAHKQAKIRIVTDNMQGAQLTAFNNSIDKAVQGKSINITDVTILEKEEYDSVDSNLMQFVDMQIYALSRFIMPSNNNILMDFEDFAIEHSEGTIHEAAKRKGNLSIHILAAKYHLLGELFHSLRHTIRKNQYHQGISEPESSCCLLSDRAIKNFGQHIDQSIHSFCSNPTHAKFMDLSKL